MTAEAPFWAGCHCLLPAFYGFPYETWTTGLDNMKSQREGGGQGGERRSVSDACGLGQDPSSEFLAETSILSFMS